jgi:hypothetical protein
MLRLVFAVLLLAPAIAEAATVTVPAGGNLQTALTNAQPGDTINLVPGVTYVGNFVLPVKPGAAYITLQTSPAGQPGAGERINPAHAPLLAKLRSPNSAPALRTAAGAHHWRIVLIEFLATTSPTGEVIQLGDGSSAQSSLSQVPFEIVVDRCYIHADPGVPQKRGIALNSASTTITGSYISQFKLAGQDSQAILGWNGPGPFVITNNYLEGAGENLMFGGADPAIANLVPSDITIAGNTFAKPLEWRSQGWQIKNLLELKNARRVSIVRNLFQYNWAAAQAGFAIVFTVRNQDGGCPWCQVEDVVFEHNVVRNVAAGVNILGFDNNHPSLQTRAIDIRNNVFEINTAAWGGRGYFIQVVGGPADITVDHNTVIQEPAEGIIFAEGPPIYGFTFTNNLTRRNLYGIIGTDHGPGMDTINTYFPGSFIANNVIADANPASYPGSNFFPSSTEFRTHFVSYATRDYRLVDGSWWNGAGTDGQDLGTWLEPGPSHVRVQLLVPGNGQPVTQPFTLSGWAFDEGAQHTIGVDAVHVYAYPSSGQAPVFLGVAQQSAMVWDFQLASSAGLGAANFTLQVTGLTAGTYRLVAFARSTLTNQFTAAAADVSIASSTAIMIDQPFASATVQQPFVVSGWALDKAASGSAGVDAIHVWAYPDNGRAPIFVGAGQPVIPRPDVAAFFGAQFGLPGYSLTVSGLPPGRYRLVVFARSTLSRTFDARVVSVIVK